MESHVKVSQLCRLLLHDIESAISIFETLDELRVGEAETTEGCCLGVIDRVRHDGSNGRAEPVSDVDVGAVFEREGL